mmetsp:Transcript_68098/g.120472  ORF Transcript_68098/g.120472 Transcript_68098/m.120472 type:complete len:104 (-) Transcript_68098:16-327(-)
MAPPGCGSARPNRCTRQIIGQGEAEGPAQADARTMSLKQKQKRNGGHAPWTQRQRPLNAAGCPTPPSHPRVALFRRPHPPAPMPPPADGSTHALAPTQTLTPQ